MTTPDPREDGGAAFPQPERREPVTMDGMQGVMITPASSGMSLLDFFAAAALTGLCAQLTTKAVEEIAERAEGVETDVRAAYTYARAMLSERARDGRKG